MKKPNAKLSRCRKRMMFLASLLIAFPPSLFAVVTVNAVGYVNVELSPGLNLIANPLDNQGPNNDANVIMPNMPDGAALFRFDPATQRYRNAATYFAGSGWYPVSGDTNDPVLVLNPGEGFFIHTPRTNSITFVGNVLQGSLTNPIPANYSLKASMVPQAGLLQTDLKFKPVQNDLIWRWDRASQSYTVPSPYLYDSADWYEGNGSGGQSEPSINVAEGFFIHREPGSATPGNWWIRNFTVQLSSSTLVAQQPGQPAAQPSSVPTIARMAIKGGTVTLNLLNPGGGSYDVQFSADGLAWTTVATQQTGTTWTGPYPGGTTGYYQIVNR